MRVLFINPPECAASGLMDLAAFEPLGLELLAASLAPRHETRLLDLVFEKRDVESAIADFKPGMVCMGCFTSQVYAVRELLRRAKRCDPGLVTVVGGYHPTFMPGDFDEPFVDAVGIGPGVPALAELADTLEAGGDWRLGDKNTLGATYTFERTERTHREVATTNDNSLKISWHNRASSAKSTRSIGLMSSQPSRFFQVETVPSGVCSNSAMARSG